MLKYHKYASVIIGLLFLVVLQIFSNPLPVFRIYLPLFLLYVLLVALYNRWYLKKLQKYNFWTLLKTPLFLLSGFGIFLIIPFVGLRSFFLVISVALIAFFELTIDSFSENLLTGETLITAFGLFFSLAAFSQYFPGFKFLAVGCSFAGAALLARTFYELIPQENYLKSVSAMILGLFSAEFFWALTFLPFHFSVLGLILFDLFYFFALTNYYYFFNTLNFKKLQFHLILVVFASAIVLLATPWKL
jgi:hypothetical protein